MAIKEEWEIDASGVRKGLKTVEQAVEQSAKRQARTVEREGKDAAARAARAALQGLRAEWRARVGLAREELVRGAIDVDEFRRRSNEAARQFNIGIFRALKQLREQGKENTDEYVRLQNALKRVGPAARSGFREATQSGNAFQRMLQSLITSTKTWIAGFLGFQALRMGARLMRNMTHEVIQLDAAMTDSVAIMTGITGTMRKEMDRRARHVARRLNQDAHVVAEGYRFLAQAGLDAEQSLNSIALVSTFATAGKFDLARATDLLTDAQSALGLAVEDNTQNLTNLTRVADVLTRANTVANATIEQFSVALTNRAAPALRMVNKDVEEGVAILAAMADQGTKGEEAGTRLDIVLRDLQRTALKNRDTFEQLNIHVFDSEGKFRNIADVIGDLERALDGLSDEQRRATINMLGFQERSVSALLQLIGVSDKIREYEAALRDAAGTTQRVADRQLASIENRWGRVGQKVAEVRRRFADTIALPVAEWFVGVGDALLQLDDPLERSIDRLQQFGDAAEGVMVAQLMTRAQSLRLEIEELEKELEESHLVIATGTIRRGRPVLPGIPTVALGGLGVAGVERMLTSLANELAEAEIKLLEAKAERNELDEEWWKRERARLQASFDSLKEYREQQERLNEATDHLRRTEEALGQTRERYDMRRQLVGLTERIRELRELERDELSDLIDHLEAERERLERVLAGDTDDAPPSDGPTNEQIAAAREAFDALEQAMQEYTLAGEMGLRDLATASTEVTQALQTLLSAQNRLAKAEEELNTIRAGGLEVPPGALEYLRFLEELRDGARAAAREVIDRWQRELPEVAIEMQNSIGRLPMAMVLMEDGAVRLDTAMNGVVRRTREVAAAEAELRRAQLTQDTERAERAEKKLAEARKELRNYTAELAKALEAAGIDGEKLEALLERLEALLAKAGIEIGKADENTSDLAHNLSKVASAARGIMSVADAMGALDDQTRRAIEGAINLAEGLSKVVASSGTDIGGWIQAIGGAVGLGAALFGKDPEVSKRAEEQRRAMMSLTDALWSLQKTILNESTRQLERDRDQVQQASRFLAGAPGVHRSGPRRREALRDTAVRLGLITEAERQADPQAALDALRRWARDLDERLGTNLAQFVERDDPSGLRDALREALPEIEDQLGKLGSFGDDAAGVIARVNFELDILGETDAVERLRAVVQALRDAGHEAGEFQEALDELASLDLDTPEGRERRDAIVREMAARLAEGGADLGELTAKQLEDLIRGWAEVSPEPGVSRSVQIGTSITEVQANEVIAWLQEIAHWTRVGAEGEASPALAVAAEIEKDMADLLAGLSSAVRTVTPEYIQEVVNNFDFRDARFGALTEHQVEDILDQLRDELHRRTRRGF